MPSRAGRASRPAPFVEPVERSTQQDAAKTRARRRATVALRMIVSAALLALLLSRVDLARLVAVWSRTVPSLLLAALALQLAGVFISSAKWWLLLRARGAMVPYLWTVRGYLIGQFFNNFLPTMIGGDAVRVYLLNERIGNLGLAFASVFVERLTGFLALTSIAWIALAFSLPALQGAPELLWGVLWCVLLASAAIAAALFAPVLLRLLARLRLRDYLGWRGRLQNVAQVIGGYSAYPGALAMAMVLSFAYQLSWIATVGTVARALRLEPAWSHVALMVPISDIIALVPIFFNGLGAREGTYVLLLGQLAGQATAAAVALAFLVFVVRLAVSALGGLLYFLGGTRVAQANAAVALTHHPSRAPRAPTGPEEANGR
jgi:uncharacterized membrane protein YbhN (UPF0104 family)